MAYSDYPVWTFPANWGDGGVLERLEWKTDVLAGETNVEQRIPRRLSPRRTIEAGFLIAKRDRQYLDNFMTFAAGEDLLVPLWPSIAAITAVAPSGSNILTFDTRWREHYVGGAVLIRGSNPQEYEVHEVAAITDSSLQLISNFGRNWPIGTRVYPLRVARIDNDAKSSKVSDQAITLRAAFSVRQANVYPFSASSLPTYDGFPVLHPRPDDSEALEFGHSRNMLKLDNEFGLVDYMDGWGRGYKTMGYRWSYVGRQNYDMLKKLTYYLKGRARAVWVPTFMEDFTLLEDITASDTSLAVSNVGFHRLSGGVLQEGRTVLRIELWGGTTYYRKIVATAETNDTLESLGVDVALPAIAMSQVRSISFMSLCHLEQDTMELDHPTDTDGVTSCAVVWRERRDPPPNPPAPTPEVEPPCFCYGA